MPKHTDKEILEAVKRLLDVQRRLRKECPWDRKQTYESLRPNTIEEVYELSDALAKGDTAEIAKELGDVMEHVMLYSIIGEETETFDLADVCNHQSDKLMFRHDFINWSGWTITDPSLTVSPQGQVVYRDELENLQANAPTSDNQPQTAKQVESSWEKRKQRERDGNKSVLGGVPNALPSMIKAYRIQDKARNVGFDWREPHDVWTKVREELGELEDELEKGDAERSTLELGDFIFSIVNAARLYRLNPDNALEAANQKFISRFNHIEQRAKEQGRRLSDLTLDEMDKLWDEAKELEKGSVE